MSGATHFTVRVTPTTDIARVAGQLRDALTPTSGKPPTDPNTDAMLELLTQTISRLQGNLQSPVAHRSAGGDTRLSIAGASIRVTTAPETTIERLLNRLSKRRATIE